MEMKQLYQLYLGVYQLQPVLFDLYHLMFLEQNFNQTPEMLFYRCSKDQVLHVGLDKT